MAPSERGQSCPLSTRLLREGLLRFAGGVPAPTRLLAVGACGRTVLLPAHVNRRLLTGTRATAASGLRIFFRSCHINLHETLVSMTGLSRSMPLRGSLILWDQSGSTAPGVSRMFLRATLRRGGLPGLGHDRAPDQCERRQRRLQLGQVCGQVVENRE